MLKANNESHYYVPFNFGLIAFYLSSIILYFGHIFFYHNLILLQQIKALNHVFLFFGLISISLYRTNTCMSNGWVDFQELLEMILDP